MQSALPCARAGWLLRLSTQFTRGSLTVRQDSIARFFHIGSGTARIRRETTFSCIHGLLVEGIVVNLRPTEYCMIGLYEIDGVGVVPFGGRFALLGPFHGAIAVPSVTRCRCRRCCCGHRCAGGDTW